MKNSVKRRLGNNTLEDTIEMSRQVRSLMETPAWGFITDLVDVMGSEIDALVERGIHEQAEYAAMVAERRTLRSLGAIAEGIVEAGEDAERQIIELNAMGDTHE